MKLQEISTGSQAVEAAEWVQQNVIGIHQDAALQVAADLIKNGFEWSTDKAGGAHFNHSTARVALVKHPNPPQHLVKVYVKDEEGAGVARVYTFLHFETHRIMDTIAHDRSRMNESIGSDAVAFSEYINDPKLRIEKRDLLKFEKLALHLLKDGWTFREGGFFIKEHWTVSLPKATWASKHRYKARLNYTQKVAGNPVKHASEIYSADELLADLPFHMEEVEEMAFT